MTKFIPVLVAVILCALPAQANAGSLSSDQIQKFISSWSDVKALSRQMEAEGKNNVLKEKAKPMQGEEFKPYTKAVSALKTQFPEEYSELGDIVIKHGFTSQESWAETGNDIMHAFAAAQMQASGHNTAAMRAQITPEMMAQMPPETRAQMEASFSMMQQFENVPAENIKAINPFIPQIESMTEKN